MTSPDLPPHGGTPSLPGLTPGLAESIVATVREPLVVLASDLRVLTANSAFYSTFKVDPRETLGRCIFDLGNGQWDIPDLRTALEDVLPASSQFSDFEVTCDFESIGTRTMLLNGRRLSTGRDSDEFILLAIEDMTDRVAWQEKEARLERRVQERTEELDRANAALAQRNTELQHFAYVASHDLQEPLRKVSAFSTILHEDHAAHLDDEGRLFLERIRDAAGRMAELIEDLLAFSRIGTRELKTTSVDLSRVLTNVIIDLDVSVQETGARINVQPLPTIEASPMQMRQLFQNLLGNALKFHPPDRRPEIDISAEPAIREGAWLIKVRDNGIGFDEKYLDRMFTPFQRLHSRKEYRGTGMGLAICRRIAERHGGSITAVSVPGDGATFVVELPERPPKPATEATARALPSTDAGDSD